VEAQRAAFIKSKGTPSYSFDYGLKVLEAALAVGRQADPLGPDEASSRMKEAQARATGPTSVADSPVFAKIKKWFEPKLVA
jgi:hypothetical protein